LQSYSEFKKIIDDAERACSKDLPCIAIFQKFVKACFN